MRSRMRAVGIWPLRHLETVPWGILARRANSVGLMPIASITWAKRWENCLFILFRIYYEHSIQARICRITTCISRQFFCHASNAMGQNQDPHARARHLQPERPREAARRQPVDGQPRTQRPANVD